VRRFLQTKVIGIISKIVLALEHNPLSIMVVATKTSNSPFIKPALTLRVFSFHLSVAYSTRIGYQSLNHSSHLLNILNAVVNKENLSVSLNFIKSHPESILH
jgi:hypothetical protein